jgi:signal transduction histidine kinase/CheY-like chemotaxis protein
MPLRGILEAINSMLKKFLYDNFIVILFLIAGFLVMGIAVYTSVFINSLSSYFRGSIDERLRFISLSASRLITAEELAELSVPEDMEKPLFAEARNRLIKFGEEAHVLFVYFIRPLENGMAQYIVDNDTSEEAVNLASDLIQQEEDFRRSYEEGITVITGMGEYSPGFDGLVSAFTPVFDSGGNVLAVAGVDIPDEEVLYIRNHILALSVIILLATAVVIGTGVLSFSINRKKQEAFMMRVKQQEVMAQLSRNFVSSGDTSLLITDALRITGEFLNVSRIVIRIAEQNSELSHAAYVWSKSGQTITNSDTVGLNDLLNNTFPLEKTEDIKTIFCNNVSKDRYFVAMDIVGVKAFIWAPLYVEGSRWAIISIEGFSPRSWTENDRQLVGTVSNVIAGAVERDLREKERDVAREQAERASKAKSNFLANMSHEMRTPMNAIIGMTSIAKNSHDIEKKEYCLNKIENASTHLLGVINDILDMSKIEANKFELSPAEFNFEKMLQKVVNVINFKVDEKHQIFSLHLDPNIPAVLCGDDQRLSQVIANLLSNAVKFTPEGGAIRLEAKLEHKEGLLCTLLISVTDTGIGVSPDQQLRLFGSFEQAESGTSRKFGGTGLGLAISKRIVEMMGGSIQVVSELGKGAAFVFTAQMEEAVGALEEIPAPVNWSGVKVLAVDDDGDIREYFSSIAERLGFSCETAASGEDALAMIEKNGAYDIYFVDWKMPGLDGIELSRRIQEEGKARSIIIMMSAVDWNTVENEAKQAGVDNFLPKPLFPSGVADCISRSLGISEQVASPEMGESLGHFEGKKLLLAEDVDINREIVMTLLEPTGLAIDCAENGLEAVKLFKQSPNSYDMIFMDVQMPEMDGYEATRQIRAFEAEQKPVHAVASETYRDVPKQVPIIAMTANVFKEDIEHCLEAGMNGHVGKPLDLHDVMDKLHQFL